MLHLPARMIALLRRFLAWHRAAVAAEQARIRRQQARPPYRRVTIDEWLAAQPPPAEARCGGCRPGRHDQFDVPF